MLRSYYGTLSAVLQHACGVGHVGNAESSEGDGGIEGGNTAVEGPWVWADVEVVCSDEFLKHCRADSGGWYQLELVEGAGCLYCHRGPEGGVDFVLKLQREVA